MSFDEITQLINNLGFPAVVCGVLFWFLKNMMENNQKLLIELKQSIDNNTKVIDIYMKGEKDD